MSKKIITISREYGSGGHEIGKLLAERLGYAFYDKEIVEEAARQTLLPESFIEKYGETTKGSNVFSNFFYGQFVADPSTNQYIFDTQKKIIRELAAKGNCVIVGRCADYYLKGEPDVLNVFIYADKLNRINRISERNDCSLTEAASMIRDIDKKRSLNYQYCTEQKWGSRENYHLSLDSSAIGIEKCVDILAQLAAI